MTAPALDRFGRATHYGDRPILWQPFDGFQTRVLRSRAFEEGVGGGKGCGKSDLVPIWMLEDSHQPQFKGLVLRRTYDELQEILDRMHRIYARLPVSRRPYWHGMERRWKFPSRATVRVGYCKDVSSLRVYRGQEWTRIGYDEVGDQPDERVWDGLVAEIRSPDTSLHRAIMGTWNWGLAGHPWLYRRFYVACDKGARTAWRKFVMEDGAVQHLSRRFHPGTVRDNPVYAKDPVYMAQLMSLPERQRKLLLLGDPEAAGGLALNELLPAKHFVHAFDVPAHWNLFAGFDWGFAHKFAYIYGAVDEDGRVYVCDTIWGHGLGDALIVQRVKDRAPIDRIKATHAGHDCWSEIKAREGSAGPTTASRFAEGKVLLTKAQISRVQGLNNLRHYLAWKGLGPDGADIDPVLRFMDTPGNRKLFAQLERLVSDPDDPRDVLKVDADADQAADPDDVSGDDGYDALRYMMMSRPFTARPTMGDRHVRAFSREALAYERESLYRHRSRLTQDDPTSPFHQTELGELAG
jgi:hypothetical protein